MKYDDEKFPGIESYEQMAKAYSESLKKKGFMVVRIDDQKNKELIEQTMTILAQIKRLLFRLGGFLNTGKLYSLTERQTKKLEIIFDEICPKNFPINFNDKTKTFLEYISLEAKLTKNLIELMEQSNFENEILKILNDRLTLLGNLF